MALNYQSRQDAKSVAHLMRIALGQRRKETPSILISMHHTEV